jgi:hypothetical protein
MLTEMLTEMLTGMLKGDITKWHNYIQNKLNNHTPHSNTIERVKRLNNNHEHITPGICQQLRFIIDKITHAFAASLVTIYDTDIFDSLFIIIRPYLPEHLREYIHTFITNSPWLDTLRQGFITTLGLIREHILISHDDNNTVGSKILLEAHINESIYNIINCWVISCVTLLFCKVLFALPMLELNLPYLFFVAGSYSIVDFAIDDNTMHPQVIRNILDLFEHELSGKSQTSNDSAEGLSKPMSKAIKNLVQTYTQHADPNATKLQAIIYSMATEKECFKKQRRHMIHVGDNKTKSEALSIPEIITLTISKGLSTGYLILASLSQSNYDTCVNPGNQAQLNLFNQYCILLQFLDDLSDYTKDSAAKISTSAGLFVSRSYPAFAWFVLDCVLDFLDAVQESGVFDQRMSSGFNILIINYWCYCCNKNIDAIGHETELLSVITDNYMFDMEYVLQMRDQKHKKKYELYKLLIKELNPILPML